MAEVNIIDTVINHSLELMTEEKKEETRQLYAKRLKFNKKLLRLISKYIKENPQFRFIQALHSLTICGQIDRFYEESELTYDRVVKILEQQEEMRNKLKKETEDE